MNEPDTDSSDPGCALEWRRGVALAFPVPFLPAERDVASSGPGGQVGAGGYILWSATMGLRKKVTDWWLLV